MLTADRDLCYPREVHRIEDTGISQGPLVDLVLKHIYLEGTVALRTVADRTKLAAPVIHSIFRFLQKEQLCDTRGMIGEDYEIALSNKGRAMAEVAFKKSQYAGPAPVPLAEYN